MRDLTHVCYAFYIFLAARLLPWAGRFPREMVNGTTVVNPVTTMEMIHSRRIYLPARVYTPFARFLECRLTYITKFVRNNNEKKNTA